MLEIVKKQRTCHFLTKIYISNVGYSIQFQKQSLYLAILPLFESGKEYRQNIVNKIKNRYKPVCNSDETIKSKPDYVVRTAKVSEKFSCPCCGAEMKSEKILEKSTLYRCTGCGISDTKLNS